MLAVIIPAHNEAEVIQSCLIAIHAASRHPALDDEEVEIVVVADACCDATAALASAMRAHVIVSDAGNVGMARKIGADRAIGFGARWLAFTDADTVVSSEWLVQQLQCRSDVVCGTVEVLNWPSNAHTAKQVFLHSYKDVDGHSHIHGANLGVATVAYLKAGGFAPLPAHEDVHLVNMLRDIGATISWSAAPRVFTSSRFGSKTSDGFGATLRRWNEASALAELPPSARPPEIAPIGSALNTATSGETSLRTARLQ